MRKALILLAPVSLMALAACSKAGHEESAVFDEPAAEGAVAPGEAAAEASTDSETTSALARRKLRSKA